MAGLDTQNERTIDVRLVAADQRLLAAASLGGDALTAELGVVIPAGWPEFPTAIPATREFLTLFPDQAQWSMYFFIHDPAQTLVGSGGFKGEPLDGMVEIGYEIAPAWRNRGAATAAAAALVDRARTSGVVDVVVAETVAAEDASGAVLRKLGFVRTKSDAGDTAVIGDTWRWELELGPRS